MDWNKKATPGITHLIYQVQPELLQLGFDVYFCEEGIRCDSTLGLHSPIVVNDYWMPGIEELILRSVTMYEPARCAVNSEWTEKPFSADDPRLFAHFIIVTCRQRYQESATETVAQLLKATRAEIEAMIVMLNPEHHET